MDERGRQSAVTRDTGDGSPVTAFVALGSNIGDSVERIRSGLRRLAALPQTRVARASSLYRNPPAGYREQPDFINAAAQLETQLSPRALLERLLDIERAEGRVRAMPNGPRTLDLDIVLYGDRVIDEPGLTIPHPRMCERAFVLVPMVEIAPDAIVPGKGRVDGLLAAVDATGLAKVPAAPQRRSGTGR